MTKKEKILELIKTLKEIENTPNSDLGLSNDAPKLEFAPLYFDILRQLAESDD